MVSVVDLLGALRQALAGRGDRAVVRLGGQYVPAGGPASKVFPPTYPVDREHPSPYVLESRVLGGEQRESVQLDSVPSQANRCEEALLRAREAGQVALPLIVLEHKGAVTVRLTSLEFPHRYADAYLRDADLDGVRFDKSALGASMLGSDLADASGLFRHDPGSLVYGAWNSHRKGRQVKFPRVYSSEMVGWDPVVGDRRAGRMDPLNLTGAANPAGEEWEFAAVPEKVKSIRLSKIGHGNIAPGPAHGGVTISGATRFGWLSLAALNRIGFGAASVEAQVAARVCLAAYALLADRLTFGGPALWLRSGCELVLASDSTAWVLRGGVEEPFVLDVAAAVELFGLAQQAAAEAGLSMATQTVELTPTPALAKAIDFALTKADAEEG
jgi:CRISPR-associated protein Csb1